MSLTTRSTYWAASGVTGEAYRPSTASALRLRPLDQPRHVARMARPELRQVGRDRPRHHQPLRVRVDDVGAARRQHRRARHQVGVEPDVHAQAGLAGRRDRVGERIERAGEAGAARLDGAVVVGVAAAAHLEQQRVEAAARGGRRRGDRSGRAASAIRAGPRARGSPGCGPGAARAAATAAPRCAAAGERAPGAVPSRTSASMAPIPARRVGVQTRIVRIV